MQDFYNLVDVYLDAVLHPKCIEDERTFAQEGWHYELEDPKVSLFSLPHQGIPSLSRILHLQNLGRKSEEALRARSKPH